MDEPLAFRSEPDAGVLSVVKSAQQAVLDQSDDPIGVLFIELASVPDGAAYLALGLEVAYAEHQGFGVVQRLDLHLSFFTKDAPSAPLVEEILGEFAGTAFTSVCLTEPNTGQELIDATLHFSPRLRFIARCTALVSDELSPEQISACSGVLESLGIRCAARGATLEVSGRQLRAALTRAAQLEAFERAVRSGNAVELYAATLPVTRAARLAVRPARKQSDAVEQSGEPPSPGTGFDVVCTLSRMLPPESSSAARDAVSLRDFAARRFGVDFGGQNWLVANAHGQKAEHRPRGPLGSRRPLQWSLNFGARRR